MLEIVDNASSPALLKVIGVGGGGSNAVNRMIQSGLRDVEFWVSNTDQQALERSHCHNRIQIGTDTTKGLGAGGDPEIGRISAEEDLAEIEAFVSGADMLFITAGMGGGTGTGAAPVIARIARELGILTVAIVTRPFHFEGKKRLSRARRGLEALAEHVDTLITIPNQKLMEIVEPGTSFDDALLMADDVLFQATRGISDLVMGHGIINLDFADVRTVMRNRGNALLGSGVGTGERRAVDAARAAVSSPLLEDLSIAGAEALLVNIQGGSSMGFHEAAEAAQFIADQVGEEADVFWGAVVDGSLEDEMRVTLVATGFPELNSGTESVSNLEARPVSATSSTGANPLVSASSSEPRREELESAPALESQPRELVEAKAGRVSEPEQAKPLSAETPAAVGGGRRRNRKRRRVVEPIEVVEENRGSAEPRNESGSTNRSDGRSESRPESRTEARRPLRRPPVIGSAVGQETDSDGVSAPRPARSKSAETVPAKTVGYRERRPDSSSSREPVRRSEASSADVLRGADPGLQHARWGQDESEERSGKTRSEKRNPLDVPTFLRKRMDD